MLRLLVALDFSDCSRLALGAAIDIARRVSPTELVVLTVLEDVRDDQGQREQALDELERACTAMHKLVEAVLGQGAPPHQLPGGTKVHYTTARGTPADEIIAQAAIHHVDAIVIGTHGRTGLNRLLTGSVAERVVRTAPCSVLTVKPKKTV